MPAHNVQFARLVAAESLSPCRFEAHCCHDCLTDAGRHGAAKRNAQSSAGQVNPHLCLGYQLLMTLTSKHGNLTLNAKKLYRTISVTLHASNRETKFNSMVYCPRGMTVMPLLAICTGAATIMPQTTHTLEATCKTTGEPACAEIAQCCKACSKAGRVGKRSQEMWVDIQSHMACSAPVVMTGALTTPRTLCSTCRMAINVEQA